MGNGLSKLSSQMISVSCHCCQAILDSLRRKTQNMCYLDSQSNAALTRVLNKVGAQPSRLQSDVHLVTAKQRKFSRAREQHQMVVHRKPPHLYVSVCSVGHKIQLILHLPHTPQLIKSTVYTMKYGLIDHMRCLCRQQLVHSAKSFACERKRTNMVPCCMMQNTVRYLLTQWSMLAVERLPTQWST